MAFRNVTSTIFSYNFTTINQCCMKNFLPRTCRTMPLLLLSWVMCVGAIAQDRRVTGRVKDETGTGLPGVSVVLKGSQQGTTTDAEGQYTVAVTGTNPTLVFSFVGYLSQEVAVGNRSAIDLSLKADNKTLDEIVVIGYGTTRKSDLTGAVATA